MCAKVLSLSIDFYVRVFVRVFTSPQTVKDSPTKVAYLYQSRGCDSFYLQSVGRKVSSRVQSHEFCAIMAPSETQLSFIHTQIMDTRTYLLLCKGITAWNPGHIGGLPACLVSNIDVCAPCPPRGFKSNQDMLLQHVGYLIQGCRQPTTCLYFLRPWWPCRT